MQKLFSILGLVGVGVLGRLVPHLPNATPITAITVSGSRYVGRVWAVVIPLLAMALSDVVIGFYDWKVLLSVYLSFALIGVATSLLKKDTGIMPTMLFVVGSSLLFFVITNFTVWLSSPWYEKSIPGLLYCYYLGLPFLRNMLVGDLVYSTILLYGLQTILRNIGAYQAKQRKSRLGEACT
jgi:hypothetical protein